LASGATSGHRAVPTQAQTEGNKHARRIITAIDADNLSIIGIDLESTELNSSEIDTGLFADLVDAFGAVRIYIQVVGEPFNAITGRLNDISALLPVYTICIVPGGVPAMADKGPFSYAVHYLIHSYMGPLPIQFSGLWILSQVVSNMRMFE
jgi:hypothetical protein